MTVSKLAQGSIIAWSKCNPKWYPVSRITPHQMAAYWTGAQCASYFKTSNVQSSANYCIGYDGSIVCNVPEEYRAWTSSSPDNDHRAITVELSNSRAGAPYMTDATIEAFIRLCVDLIRRYPGLGGSFRYTGNLNGNVSLHRWFANTNCPGSYFEAKLQYIQSEVNRRLKEGAYVGIIQVQPNMTDAQLWRFVECEDGYLKVENKSGKVLDVKGGTGEQMKDGRVVQAYRDNGTDAQRWRKTEGVAGGFRLVSKLDETFCLDVKNGTVGARKNILLHRLQPDDKNQWAQSFVELPYYGGGWVSIVNCKSGFAIDANPNGYDYS